MPRFLRRRVGVRQPTLAIDVEVKDLWVPGGCRGDGKPNFRTQLITIHVAKL